MINVLKREQLLSTQFVYVEFGAGRGGLSHWLNLCLASEQHENQDALENEVAWITKPVDTVFVLIELKSTRYKYDIRHREAGNFIRLHMDIAQLNLGKCF
ncbi:unnamed protein product [Echinostoma caproni]|uniref:tRNA:m(4)X modification enzyme TRM13 n=1 Tax=Echinostoma caproni TaxID=27848 RepID=A0A3P8HLK6_9TREM|nr:unnamed protein product [Echinostoma caproni]